MGPAAQQPLESPEPLSSAQGRSWAALETPSAPAAASPAMMRARAALIAENEDVRPTTLFDIAHMTYFLVNVSGSGFKFLWPLQMLLVMMMHVSFVEEGEHAQQALERVLQAEQKRLLQERVRWQADFQQAKARLEGVNQRLQDLNVK